MKTQIFLMTLLIFGISNPAGAQGTFPTPPQIRQCVPNEVSGVGSLPNTKAFPCVTVTDSGVVLVDGFSAEAERLGVPIKVHQGSCGNPPCLEDTIKSGQNTARDQGIPVEDPERFLKVKGYSDLDYGMLEEVLNERIKSLTKITVMSIKMGLCTTVGIIPVTGDLEDHDIKCYFMDFSGNFIEEVSGDSNQIFTCDVLIFAGDRPVPNLLLQDCGNEKYIVELGAEPDGSKNNVVSFEELGLISLATRREIIQ